MAGKNILLIEPGYKNKYPPLGLMNIAQYHGGHGKGDRVKFIKGKDTSVLSEAWDRIPSSLGSASAMYCDCSSASKMPVRLQVVLTVMGYSYTQAVQ